ncbi:MAG: hypothetical protein WAJ85_10115 [Candidatus Baltobacteraceae bacterium]
MKIQNSILVAAIAVGLGLAARLPADATLCTVPNTFSVGSIINAAPFNANFSALQTCGNSIDNTNIGSAGLYASNLLPTSGAQATFGGLVPYTFNNSLTANAGNTTVVPFTANGASGQTADLADYDVNGSKLAWFDASGVLHGTSAAFSSSLSAVGITSTAGVAVGGPLTTATTGSFSGAVNVGSLSSSGAVSGSGYSGGPVSGTTGAFSSTIQGSSNGSTVSYVGPVYTTGGSAVASTFHFGYGTASCTVVSLSCTVTVNLSGAAAYSSATSYSVGATLEGFNNGQILGLTSKTASSFVLGAGGESAGTYTFDFVLAGT